MIGYEIEREKITQNIAEIQRLLDRAAPAAPKQIPKRQLSAAYRLSEQAVLSGLTVEVVQAFSP